MQVGDHTSGFKQFLKEAKFLKEASEEEKEAARAFEEMRYLRKRKVPQLLYDLIVEDLQCVPRECENPVHAGQPCACQTVVSRCVRT